MALEDFAPGGAVVVEAFRCSIEEEVNALSVVAVEAGVVEVVSECGGVAGICA